MAEYLHTVACIVLFSCVPGIVVSLLDLVRVWLDDDRSQWLSGKSLLIRVGWVPDFPRNKHACAHVRFVEQF